MAHGLSSSFDAIRERHVLPPCSFRGRARTPTMLSSTPTDDDDASPSQHMRSGSPLAGTREPSDDIFSDESSGGNVSALGVSSTRPAIFGVGRRLAQRGRSQEPRVFSKMRASNYNTVAASQIPLAPTEEQSPTLSRRPNNGRHNQ
jgi:hypothetical protein